MTISLSRSTIAVCVVAGLGALLTGYQFVAASPDSYDVSQSTVSQQQKLAPKSIAWTDLLPEGQPMVFPHETESDFSDVKASPFALVDRGGSETGGMGNIEMSFTPMPAAKGRKELANQFVKLAGYMTPLNVEQGKTRTFLLVPYVGACIHVPAPPANQIVLVESKEPIEVRRMWEPFEAVGTLHVETLSTQLADVSYTMDLNRIESYVEKPAS